MVDIEEVDKSNNSGYAKSIPAMFSASSILSVIGVVIAVIFLIAAIMGNIELDKKVAACTETMLVSCTSESVSDHLVAPRYGDRVITRYEHSAAYEWAVGEESYAVHLHMTTSHQYNKLPEFITIRYNPDDPDSYVVERGSVMEDTNAYISIFTDRKTGVVEPIRE